MSGFVVVERPFVRGSSAASVYQAFVYFTFWVLLLWGSVHPSIPPSPTPNPKQAQSEALLGVRAGAQPWVHACRLKIRKSGIETRNQENTCDACHIVNMWPWFMAQGSVLESS